MRTASVAPGAAGPALAVRRGPNTVNPDGIIPGLMVCGRPRKRRTHAASRARGVGKPNSKLRITASSMKTKASPTI